MKKLTISISTIGIFISCLLLITFVMKSEFGEISALRSILILVGGIVLTIFWSWLVSNQKDD